MIQIHRTPELLKKLYPSLIWDKKPDEKELYLTFDDGPHPEITSWVLDTLSQVEGRATFFCVGENLARNTPVAQRALIQGSVIGNHTQNHLKGWKTDDARYLENIVACEQVITHLIDGENRLFRPPYGRIKRSQVQAIQSRYQIIMWSHLSWDFDPKLSVRTSIKNLKKADSGSIIVFHDSVKAYKNLKKLLPELLTYWSDNGFKFAVL